MTGSLNRRSSDVASGLLMLAGLAAAVVAPLILLIELYEWVTSREWPGLTVADGLALFGLVRADGESEVQRLTDLMMAAPLTIALFVAGVYMFLAGASLGSWERERELRRELEGKSLLAWLSLCGASDVSHPTVIRLFLLDSLLRALSWLGAAFVVGELVLLALGIDLRWLGIYGVLLVLAAVAARRLTERRLPPY